MAIDVKNLLQDIADAVEHHNEKSAEMSAAKTAFEVAQTAFLEAGKTLEDLRAQLNELLGNAATNRVR